MTVVITPVGTSLFSNAAEENNQIRQYYPSIENTPVSEWDSNPQYINVLKTQSEAFITREGTSATAELQSTEIIQRKLQTDISVHFLASDTIASRLAAEILRDKINEPNNILGEQVSAIFNSDSNEGRIDVIPHLQVNDTKDFSREGMPNLFSRINYIMQWIAGGSQNLAINITGGYGATLPYLTIFAQLENVPLYYNFENSDELILIPKTPLAIDWDLIKKHSGILAIIEKEIDEDKWEKFKNENHEAVETLDAFIWRDEDTGACLSPIGEIFWDQYLKSHFVVELGNGINNDTNNKKVIQELYRRLNTVLSPDKFTDDKCYNRIRENDQDDLNHTGPVQDHNIFIFKSTDDAQKRFMYTFVVNGRAITRIKLYDLKHGHLTNKEYKVWKEKIRKTHATITFTTYTYVTPKAT